MQNIYEVVGIIKGIKFDNKINEKEISFLKEWTDHNRNFAITKNQKKLIYMIDKALEDNVLTDLERKTILSTAQTILDVQSVENLDMYIELNGILRGIISDKKLNNEEIIKLKKWFDFHKIEINKNNKEILMKVDSILEDEIITNEEQNELFILIKEKIDKLEMDAKIEYVKKLIRKRENIGI